MTLDLSALSPDRPSNNPAEDAYGHAPFTKTLARAIQGYQGEEGIVLSLYGPWGSGKSTVLNYVKHELKQLKEEEQPIVVEFNPWWFSGHDDLARAFLSQLQAVLGKTGGFEKIGEAIAKYSGALGATVGFLTDVASAVVGAPPGAGSVAEKAIASAAARTAPEPKDIPGLKAELAQLLRKKERRILVIIDDIDRLTPDEVRQLFTVIKALADFPYMTYLLAFDREVATAAISQQTGLPGERFLEKIIQVPFELPVADVTALLQALVNRLNVLMAPDESFDQGHWTQVLHPGLASLIKVPRDVVRLTNALSATYPAVTGEVNPVDFIAIEALRVFQPNTYSIIRSSPEKFAGDSTRLGGSRQRDLLTAFHNAWLKQVSETNRESTQSMIRTLFPGLDFVWGNVHQPGGNWKKERRICSPDVFPI